MSNIASLDVTNMGKPVTLPKEGWYQAKLVSQEPGSTQRGSIFKMKWQIVGATLELQAERGKYVYETLYMYSNVFFQQVALIGWSLGVYSPEYLQALQAQNDDLPMPDFEDWIGRSCLIKVRHKKDQDDPNKVYTAIGFDYTTFDSVIGQATGVVLDNSCLNAEPCETAAENTDDDF